MIDGWKWVVHYFLNNLEWLPTRTNFRLYPIKFKPYNKKVRLNMSLVMILVIIS